MNTRAACVLPIIEMGGQEPASIDCEFHHIPVKMNTFVCLFVPVANSSALHWVNEDNPYHITYCHWLAEFLKIKTQIPVLLQVPSVL